MSNIMEIPHGWQTPCIGSLNCGVQGILVEKAKWKPLSSPKVLKTGTHKNEMNEKKNEMDESGLPQSDRVVASIVVAGILLE